MKLPIKPDGKHHCTQGVSGQNIRRTEDQRHFHLTLQEWSETRCLIARSSSNGNTFKLLLFLFRLRPCMSFFIFSVLSTVVHSNGLSLKFPPKTHVLRPYSLVDGIVWEGCGTLRSWGLASFSIPGRLFQACFLLSGLLQKVPTVTD